jgi:hypothetical protein
MPHSVAQWREVSGAVAGHDSEAHSGVDSPLTRMPAGVSALNAPAGGAGMGGRPVMPSSETETCSRGRLALDRDGASREGGGVQPSSETNPYSRGRSTHERGGFVRGDVVPLERTRVLPEGGWADCLTGRGPVGSFCARV